MRKILIKHEFSGYNQIDIEKLARLFISDGGLRRISMYNEKIINSLLEKSLIQDQDRLVVAVSGGADSMCLLYYLNELKQNTKFLNIQLFVAHINHHTRQGENELEEKLIRDYCLKCSIPFYKADFHHTGVGNFHDVARSFRYTFFREVAKQIHANKIVLAHHEDDQIETVLFKLIRGANILGYGGMKDMVQLEDGLYLIRPFLSLSKKDILDHCSYFNIPYLNDSSNQATHYARNKIRHQIIPLLTDIQSDATDKIIQFKTQVEEAGLVINEFALSKYNSVSTLQKDGSIKLDIVQLKGVSKSVIRLVITYAINRISNNTLSVSYGNINTLIEIMNGEKPNVTYHLGKDYYCIKEYNQLIFMYGLVSIEPYRIEINKFREYILPNHVKLNVKNVQEKVKINNKCMFLCYNTSMWPLIVRTPHQTDIIETKVGHKKINRIFINKKIPKHERDHWPIITDKNNKILWVVGLEKNNGMEKCYNDYIMIEIR